MRLPSGQTSATTPYASAACVDRLVHRLREQWRAFDATCDHRAVIPGTRAMRDTYCAAQQDGS